MTTTNIKSCSSLMSSKAKDKYNFEYMHASASWEDYVM